MSRKARGQLKSERELRVTDKTVVQTGENSPEQVAYKLLNDIAAVEGKTDMARRISDTDRKWILETYAECLKAVKGQKSNFTLDNL